MAGVDFEPVNLPMISLPVKETVDASFVGLKPLISGCYGEDPDSFDAEIKQMDRLRQTHVTKDYAGCSTLRKYFAQLHLLSARFPKDMIGGVIPLEFKWKDAFTGKQYLQEGISMEQASVLFNLAALHSQLGAKTERNSEQEIKETCTHFQCAAGVLVYLYDNFGANYCKDMAPELIEMFKTLMLAQAQECYVEKSLKYSTGLKFVTIAKLTAKLYEYYQFVMACLESDSCVTVVKANKEWPRAIQIKTQYYLALSHYFQASVCNEQAKYGEMVVYYMAAVQVIDKIGKLPKGINDSLRKAITGLCDAAKKKAMEAKKQNDFVFHEKLPSMEHLEAVQGAVLAKANVFQPADPAVIGVDIFSRLVPMKAHERSSVYSEEKAKLLRSVVAKAEEKDAELEQYLGGLNISEVRKAQQFKPLVPVQLKQKVEWFQQHIEDVTNMRTQLTELKTTAERVSDLLKVITARRQQEDEEEKEYQMKHGPRAESQVCKELWNELESCVKYHQKAAQSNTELDSLYHQHSKNIEALTNTLDSVLAHLPTISLLESPSVGESDAKRLDVVMEEVDKMKKQRKELINQLRQQISKDDITSSIIGQKDDEQEEAMSEQLQKHKNLVAIIEQNLTAQEKILEALTEVNAKHALLRDAQQDISGKQEQYFGGLLRSADIFPVLQSKVQEGLRFFTQLEDKVVKLQRRANDICDHQRRKRGGDSATPTFYGHTPSNHGAIPPARPPKRYDQRGEPLANQGFVNQPHPSAEDHAKEPVISQQPLPTFPVNILSHELNEGFPQQQDLLSQQQGLPLQQDSSSVQQGIPLQQDMSSTRQDLSSQQQRFPLHQESSQDPSLQLVASQQGFPLQPQAQQGLPQQPNELSTQQRLPQQPNELSTQQGLSLQPQELSSAQVSVNPPVNVTVLTPVEPVIVTSTVPVSPVTSLPMLPVVSYDMSLPPIVSSGMSLPHTVTSEMSLPHIVSSGISIPHTVTSGMSLPHTVSSDMSLPHIVSSGMSLPHTVTSEMSLPHIVSSGISIPHTGTSGMSLPHTVSSDVMPQSLPHTVSSGMSVPLPNTVSSDVMTQSLPHTVPSVITSNEEAISEGVVISSHDLISPSHSSLDQLNPFALLGVTSVTSPAVSAQSDVSIVPKDVKKRRESIVTTSPVTSTNTTMSSDTLLLKQQEQHVVELKQEKVLLLEQLETYKRQQEQDKVVMSGSHAALLQLVQQQQQSIQQQQTSIQQYHKENAVLRQDKDVLETKYRSMINEEQSKQQTLRQQLAHQINECQQYKQLAEGQQRHIQQLSQVVEERNHKLKLLDEQQKKLVQQLSNLDHQHKQQMAGLEEKSRMSFNQLQQEFRTAEQSYKQEINRLNQLLATSRPQVITPISTTYQQPAKPVSSFPPPHLPMQHPLQTPQQVYMQQPHLPGVQPYKPAIQSQQQPHPHQLPAAQQPHPQTIPVTSTHFYSRAS
ncbi:tyrosine-protein phosphatase non-receptor type 23-like isoform X2 [Dysidea avara]|uniref:tyrosine-protein phosphatase non-receptor type 23-like isoform X2 n=1 Tax=Dysidea avara TaxID=196820 RepID=UPI00331D50A9